MELVINEGHLVASLHPSWSPFGRECPSPPLGMGMQDRQLRPSFHTVGVLSWFPWTAEHSLFPTKLQKLWSRRGYLGADPGFRVSLWSASSPSPVRGHG